MTFNFSYRAKCLNVIDGDTIHLYIDTGFHKYEEQHIRLLGVNTPELHSAVPELKAKALAAKNFTIATLAKWSADFKDDWPIYIETFKSDAFGRWLATVWPSQHLLATDLSTLLIQAGHGVAFMVPKAQTTIHNSINSTDHIRSQYVK